MEASHLLLDMKQFTSHQQCGVFLNWMLTQLTKLQGYGEELISLNTSSQMPTTLHNHTIVLTPGSGSLYPFRKFDSFNFKTSHFNFWVNFIVLIIGQTGFYNKMCSSTSNVFCVYGENCWISFSNSCYNFSPNFHFLFSL